MDDGGLKVGQFNGAVDVVRRNLFVMGGEMVVGSLEGAGVVVGFLVTLPMS